MGPPGSDGVMRSKVEGRSFYKIWFNGVRYTVTGRRLINDLACYP